jgi:hypothetical protein
MPSTSAMSLSTVTGSQVNLADGFFLFKALDAISRMAGDTTPRRAEAALSTLTAFLAEDVRAPGGTHSTTAGIEVLVEQLRHVQGQVPDAIRAQIQQLPALQRVYRRLAELQGDPQWLFQVGAEGDIRLVTLNQAVGHSPLGLKWDASAATGETTSSLFAVEASAGLSLLLDVLPSETASAERDSDPIPIASGMCGVSLTAAGRLQASLSASATVPVVASVTAAAHAAGNLTLTYQFFAESSVLRALDAIRGDVPAPTDMGSLAAALDPPGVEGLQAVDFELTMGGQAAATVSVSLKQAAPAAVIADAAPRVSAQLGLTATVGMGMQSQLRRHIRTCKTTDGKLRISSRVTRQRASDIQAGFELGFGFSGLEDWAEHFLGRALPNVPPKLVALLEEYAQPGAMLSEALAEHIPNNQLQAIAQLALGLQSSEATAASIGERLFAPVTAAFDSVENLFDAAATAPSEIIDQLITTWLGKDVPFPVATQLAALLKDPVSRAWSSILDSLKTRAGDFWSSDIQGKTTKQVERALAPLSDALGVGRVVASVEELVEMLQGLLKRYGDWRTNAMGIVKRSLGTRLGFALHYARHDEVISWLSRVYDVDTRSATTGKQWAAAQIAFEQVLAGKTGVGSTFGGLPVTVVDETLYGKASTTGTLTATLDLLPFQAVQVTQRRAAAEIYASPTGEIRASSTEWDNSETAKSRSIAWTVRFAGSMNLADARFGRAPATLRLVSKPWCRWPPRRLLTSRSFLKDWRPPIRWRG